jgi:hypothetical protein
MVDVFSTHKYETLKSVKVILRREVGERENNEGNETRL